MTTSEVLADIRQRLDRATCELNRLARESRDKGDALNAVRLDGKAQGIQLARDYLRGYP